MIVGKVHPRKSYNTGDGKSYKNNISNHNNNRDNRDNYKAYNNISSKT